MTLGLILCMVGIHLVEWSLSRDDLLALTRLFGLVAEDIDAACAAFSAAAESNRAGGAVPAFLQKVVLPFAAHPLVHAGPFHLVSNVFCLWIFGSRLEARTSWWRFLLFWFCCTAIGGVAHMRWVDDPRVIHLGASAAAGAVAVTYVLFYRRARVRTLILPLPLFVDFPAVAVVVVWAATQFHKVQDFLGLGAGVSLGYAAQGMTCIVGGLLLGPLLLGLKSRRKDKGSRKPKKGKRKFA